MMATREELQKKLDLLQAELDSMVEKGPTYYSKSKKKDLLISEMNSVHIINAINRDFDLSDQDVQSLINLLLELGKRGTKFEDIIK